MLPVINQISSDAYEATRNVTTVANSPRTRGKLSAGMALQNDLKVIPWNGINAAKAACNSSATDLIKMLLACGYDINKTEGASLHSLEGTEHEGFILVCSVPFLGIEPIFIQLVAFHRVRFLQIIY
jgi:hypothetical protein